MWDKFVSLISVPSIFLLVTTLPVVETDSSEDGDDDTLVSLPEPGEPGNTAAPISVADGAAVQPETEWQQYRRRTRSIHSNRSYHSSPAVTPMKDSDPQLGHGEALPPPSSGLLEAQPTAINEAMEAQSMTSETEHPGWNRWLVILQIFTGPQFTVFIVWANMLESLETPGKDLVRLILYSLLGSLVLLGVLLLTTTPDKPPKYHFMFCFLGFVIAIAWISTVAEEVVGVLKAFGVIIGISEAILGLTIFAVGNSLGDLVADVTVARLGYPVMAL